LADVAQLTDPRSEVTAPTRQDIEKMSAYYLDLDRLLNRVDRATTHYQVLGLQRMAHQDDIKQAYREAVTLLHPSQYGIHVVIPDEMMTRIDNAFDRVTRAFSVLSNMGKRVAYDNMLMPKANRPIPVEPPKLSRTKVNTDVGEEKVAEDQMPREEVMNARQRIVTNPVFTKSKDDVTDSNRRRCERFKVTIPTRTIGSDRIAGKWSEISQTVDVSRTGASLMLRHRVRYGMVLYMSLPMPVKLRGHGFANQTYNVYGLVRRIEPLKDGGRVIGVEFLGEHPPVGYLEKPWVTFRTQNWSGLERRRQARVERSEPVGIEYLDQGMNVIRQEVGVTENLSPDGARVYLKAAPPEFDFVKLTNLKRSFEAVATVRNRYVGRDGFERLCLRFMNNQWPL
jgi:DnaJ-like protein/PilZ domain-containing protein